MTRVQHRSDFGAALARIARTASVCAAAAFMIGTAARIAPRSYPVIATAWTMLRAPSLASSEVRCDFTVSALVERREAD